MAHDKSVFRMVRHPLQVRLVEVREARLLTPRMKRITLGGPSLHDFVSLAPEDHVKLFFPRPGERRPVLPWLGPLGLSVALGQPKPLSRDYTPRRYDARAATLEIDFYLHGGGPASIWAEQAGPGQEIGVGGPRGSYVLTRAFAWQLFVGDETALPEIARRLEELPSSTHAFVIAGVNDASEQQALDSPARVEVEWLHRSLHDASLAGRFVEAIGRLRLPRGEGFAWIAGEASESRAAYGHLVREAGLDPRFVHASGHWKRGVSDHDHHEEISA